MKRFTHHACHTLSGNKFTKGLFLFAASSVFIMLCLNHQHTNTFYLGSAISTDCCLHFLHNSWHVLYREFCLLCRPTFQMERPIYTLSRMDPSMEWLFLELHQTLKEAGKYPVIFCFFIFMPLPVLQDYEKPRN